MESGQITVRVLGHEKAKKKLLKKLAIDVSPSGDVAIFSKCQVNFVTNVQITDVDLVVFCIYTNQIYMNLEIDEQIKDFFDFLKTNGSINKPIIFYNIKKGSVCDSIKTYVINKIDNTLYYNFEYCFINDFTSPYSQYDKCRLEFWNFFDSVMVNRGIKTVPEVTDHISKEKQISVDVRDYLRNNKKKLGITNRAVQFICTVILISLLPLIAIPTQSIWVELLMIAIVVLWMPLYALSNLRRTIRTAFVHNNSSLVCVKVTTGIASVITSYHGVCISDNKIYRIST